MQRENIKTTKTNRKCEWLYRILKIVGFEGRGRKMAFKSNKVLLLLLLPPPHSSKFKYVPSFNPHSPPHPNLPLTHTWIFHPPPPITHTQTHAKCYLFLPPSHYSEFEWSPPSLASSYHHELNKYDSPILFFSCLYRSSL